MRSLLALVFLAGVVFAVTEGYAIEPLKSQPLKKCQEKKIEKMINTIIEDTYNLKTEAYDAYESTYSAIIECVLDSFTTLVSCVEGAVEDTITDFEDDIETYISTVTSLAEKIEEYIEDCV